MASLTVDVRTRWTDYSKGWFNREVFTLSVREGAILVSILVTFITIVTAAVWSIIVFWCHRALSRRFHVTVFDRQSWDGLAWLTKAFLRHQSTPLAAVKDIMLLLWAWRHRADVKSSKQRLRIIFSYALAVAMIGAGLGVLVIFVANPAYRSSNVLLEHTANCGQPIFNTTIDAGRAALRKWNQAAVKNARFYVQNCYNETPAPFACTLYPNRKFAVTRTDVPCQYGTDTTGQSLCFYKNKSAVRLETDYLNSNTDFGFNTGPGDQIMVKKVLTCTPLHAKNLVVETRSPITMSPVYNFALGPVNKTSPYTYSYDSYTSKVGIGYQLYSVSDTNDTWDPIAPLQVSNADSSVHFLSANILRYQVPVKGPVFSATNLTGSGSIQLYSPDQYVNAIGCTQQQQLLNPNTGEESILGSVEDLAASYQHLGFNAFQEALATRFILAFTLSSTFNVAATLGPSALLASDSVMELVSSGLPEDQWIQEVQTWFETGLAYVQGSMIDVNNDRTNFDGNGFILAPDQMSNRPVDKAAVALCGMRRVRNTGGYMTFSFYGVLIVAVVGTIIIIYATFQESIVHGIESLLKKNVDLRLAWVRDNRYYQLCGNLIASGSSALKYRVMDGWDNIDDTIPVAKEGLRFIMHGQDDEAEDEEEQLEHGSAHLIAAHSESAEGVEMLPLTETQANRASHSQIEEQERALT